MKEVYLYKKLKNKNVRCITCAHRCVISEGNFGICAVRKNIGGKLYASNYNKAVAVNIDPIEKKPFFHFLPGTKSLSVATAGCNFSCKNCQNWAISQGPRLFKQIEGEFLPPEKIIEMAKKNALPSISYTYTEPTIFLEYALDTMKLAKKAGLKNCWVSNGFMSKESAKLAIPYIDANNIDIKSFSDKFYIENCGGRVQPVLDTARMMKKAGVWVEITTLVIPTLNDQENNFEKIAKFIKNKLGAETPWHITQFSGTISWKLQHLPDTPVAIIKKAYGIGKKNGLKYVYTGNIPGLLSEDTFCPKCGKKMVERFGYKIKRMDKNGKCSNCGQNLNIIL